ncbi:phospholipid carrier-dependent glycosyltransferase [Isoptericola sp. NEAU-Y5]|uniref:Polyprenol-phosphate-mannose--protein mannosyltransferase n=1 Tax=Isoptericola luteus TaxID=2879484 RepID=A0ABS7ZD10_9MICO|nr:phospholipid carrier-dependent glycosyltransferase [Isoptericola sp. NEAU-Y5]MCA5892936.1 phospholipid carrier-dependent glycosyltransferase [Isoptericola sp. NEAU-Y5]
MTEPDATAAGEPLPQGRHAADYGPGEVPEIRVRGAEPEPDLAHDPTHGPAHDAERDPGHDAFAPPGGTIAVVRPPDPFVRPRPEFTATAEVPADERSTENRLLARLLGERRLTLDLRRRDRFWAWTGTFVVTLLAAVARLWNLGRPSTLVFDETYYVKDGFTLGELGYAAQWPEDPNAAFEAGDVLTYLEKAAYVVHPPVGKWMIWLGMEAGGGATSAFAWRLGSAVVGVLAVFLLVRIARRLFSSSLMGVVAGLLLAVDGEAIVHSRTALLDQFLMFWVLVAFGCLVLDREQARRRLASRVGAILDAGGAVGLYGPRLGFRWWRVGAGVSLGLACGTKWSGLWFVAVFGIVTVLWDVSARKRAGIGRWWEDALTADAVRGFLAIVPTAVVVYVATWWSWFRSPGAYLRQWAADHPGEGVTWLPDPLRSLVEYHRQMWEFHTGLSSEHNYASHPLGWIIQWRPTSFYWEKHAAGEGGCPADTVHGCAEAVTSLGNPLLWFLGAVAILVTVSLGIRLRDGRALAVLSGTVAGWLPWFLYAPPVADRTIFTFYSIVFTPFVVLTLVYPMVVALERTEHRPGRSRAVAAITVVVTLVVAVSVAFYPLWSGMQVPYDYWRSIMRLDSWV